MGNDEKLRRLRREFGGELAMLRGRTGKTQEQLAALIEVHSVTLRYWEIGKYVPKASSLKQLINVFAEGGFFASGKEVEEIRTLWNKAREAGLKDTLDEEWLSELREMDTNALPFSQLSSPAPLIHESSHDQLLITKFLVPFSLHPLIARPRLTDLLDMIKLYPLTLVSAPAGYGKTTLLAVWVQSLPANHSCIAWLSLDEGDNSNLRFWRYVLTALDKSKPGISRDALTLLLAPEEPSLDLVLNTFINALSQQTSIYFLVLDDYHVITEQTIHRSLAYLVEHMGRQMHIILLTRTDPPLPLSRLLARRQMLEVRADQLRCTAEEATAFFHEVIGIEFAHDVFQEVMARTEGWLVGLQLFGLSLQQHIDPANVLVQLHGSSRFILDYLTEEVVRCQPTAIQDFLLRTSILESLNAPLCNIV